MQGGRVGRMLVAKIIEMGGDRQLNGVQKEAVLPMLTEAQSWEVPTQQWFGLGWILA